MFKSCINLFKKDSNNKKKDITGYKEIPIPDITEITPYQIALTRQFHNLLILEKQKRHLQNDHNILEEYQIHKLIPPSNNSNNIIISSNPTDDAELKGPSISFQFVHFVNMSTSGGDTSTVTMNTIRNDYKRYKGGEKIERKRIKMHYFTEEQINTERKQNPWTSNGNSLCNCRICNLYEKYDLNQTQVLSTILIEYIPVDPLNNIILQYLILDLAIPTWDLLSTGFNYDIEFDFCLGTQVANLNTLFRCSPFGYTLIAHGVSSGRGYSSDGFILDERTEVEIYTDNKMNKSISLNQDVQKDT